MRDLNQCVEELNLNRGSEGGIDMYPSGDSIKGYEYSPEEEEETFRIIAMMIRGLDESFELRIGKI